MFAQDARKIIITTIFKFGEMDGALNDRHNIIVLVDKAPRSQESDLDQKMRRALPHAFLLGLAGTPINRADSHTLFAFGTEGDEYGYLSRYGFEASIRDGHPQHLRRYLAKFAYRCNRRYHWAALGPRPVPACAQPPCPTASELWMRLVGKQDDLWQSQ